MEQSHKALLVGASGLIGGQLLELLLNDEYYSEVEIWLRKPTGISHPKLRERIIDFSTITDIPSVEIDHLFCCIGTTIKKAGTQDAFRKVDFEYVVNLAQLAERSTCSKFIVISSIGADSKSSNFYLRVKGEMEETVRSTRIPGIIIIRPSLLLGKRREFRLGEKIFQFLMPSINHLLIGKLKKYRGIESLNVAKAMLSLAKNDTNGISVIESDKINALAL
ncbi:MAG: NAD(P)H-binding protein [Bacteroidota bacterium]|nr:NAD(P)H-binding protein [Bacteroidota bacterium]